MKLQRSKLAGLILADVVADVARKHGATGKKKNNRKRFTIVFDPVQ